MSQGYEERTTYEPDRVVVRVNGRLLVETDLDGDGRPVQSRYAKGEVEHYRYEGGRLVEIEGAPGLLGTAIAPERWETGGRLTVEHDGHGPCAIRGEGELVWERLEESWPQLLARGADVIAEGFARDIGKRGRGPRAGCGPARSDLRRGRRPVLHRVARTR